MQDVLMKVWLNITFCSLLSKDVHVCYHHHMLLNSCFHWVRTSHMCAQKHIFNRLWNFFFAVEEVTLTMTSHCSMYLTGRNAGREMNVVTDV